MFYLIDFYSENGRLFESERILADDDAQAAERAISFPTTEAHSFYKIIRLLKSGNIVICDTKSGADLPASLPYSLKGLQRHQ